MAHIDLDYKCPTCGGGGCVEINENDAVMCGECDGVGYILTDQGQVLLAFLKRHWLREG